jgi:HSP20 family protein
MDLKIWAPFVDVDKEWRFEIPRLLREASGFRPSMDVVKTDGHMVVTAELPGISSDDVEVSLDGDILTIKGEKHEEKEVSEDDRYVHERSYGSFQRRITVPDGISADAIEASFDKGVLTVEVALPEEKPAESKRIPVSTT